ncbi:hypothetical protein EN12_21175 [Vibrio cholerae]|uniref:Uncharacterized protein n=1 Tax=Vibrio cholerae TaxID=666 RepID=A0A5B1C1N6_VIBCL|nr:hypothetical protein [Vibrio cholerae]AKO77639.1 hypothetical protein EN12_21175 [Vibrio cholerae]KAA1253643.1 hypothetical protein F0M16_16335 [Vibrio cholerae]HDV5593909.1 hypothetical protein [Vibrio cholerae]
MRRKSKMKYPLSGGYYINKENDSQFKVRTVLFHKLYRVFIENNKISIEETLNDGTIEHVGEFTTSDFLNQLTPSIPIESSFSNPEIAMAVHLAIHGILSGKDSHERIEGWV